MAPVKKLIKNTTCFGLDVNPDQAQKDKTINLKIQVYKFLYNVIAN